MFALAVAIMAFSALLAKMVITIPVQEYAMSSAVASATANNFWSYRAAVATYAAAHPATTGTIADGSLTFQTGYVRNSAWTNTVQSGVLYVYSNRTLPVTTNEAITNRGGRTLMIGIAGSTEITSATTPSVTFTLPAGIPSGAIVVIGN